MTRIKLMASAIDIFQQLYSLKTLKASALNNKKKTTNTIKTNY